MIGIDALAFVTPKGEALGAPRCGVTKITHAGKGHYLFVDLVVRPGAKVQISALPKGYPHDWQQTDQGLLVRVYDATSKPVDHGFALKIESPKAPSQPPALEFSTTLRGAHPPSTPPPSMREPILAMTEGPKTAAAVTETKPADESEPDDDSSTTTSAPTTSSPKRKEESHGRRGR